MNTQNYIALLANPQRLTDEGMQELETILARYPYFQSARALQLKGLKNQNSFLYNDALKVTAAYTTDRDILFEYITSESFAQHDISEKILQQSDAVKELDVVIAEDVSEKHSLALHDSLQKEIKKAEAILDPALFEPKEAIPPVEIFEEKPIVEEKEKQVEKPNPETTLGLDKPLDFTQRDTHSFSEWLKLTKATPIQREKIAPEVKNVGQEAKDRKFELIEKFIQESPKLEPRQTTKKNKNLAKPYTQSPDTLMTETLAKVYLQQKNYKKAIQAYKILILKNPEKSGFFADQIRAIEKLIKTEEQ
ncbi:MAG: hypothetical protein K0U54_00415 [Bacteroidetes bacterium]|nr:hypothetical protein [Bacteroidota bacterium]